MVLSGTLLASAESDGEHSSYDKKSDLMVGVEM